MPLIIHPSSSCDICFETLTAHHQSRPPFVLRCGHVFCRQCLVAMQRTQCPMCREPFIANHYRKVIASEDKHQKAIELLQSLVMSWAQPDTERAALREEVQRWLDHGNRHEALQMAHQLMDTFDVLKLELQGFQRNLVAQKEAEVERLLIQVEELRSSARFSPSLGSSRDGFSVIQVKTESWWRTFTKRLPNKKTVKICLLGFFSVLSATLLLRYLIAKTQSNTQTANVGHSSGPLKQLKDPFAPSVARIITHTQTSVSGQQKPVGQPPEAIKQRQIIRWHDALLPMTLLMIPIVVIGGRLRTLARYTFLLLKAILFRPWTYLLMPRRDAILLLALLFTVLDFARRARVFFDAAKNLSGVLGNLGVVLWEFVVAGGVSMLLLGYLVTSR